jgi:hypothetical protein
MGQRRTIQWSLTQNFVFMLLSIETYEEVDAAIRSEGEIQAVTPSIRVASINPDL